MKEGVFWIIGKTKADLSRGEFEIISFFERDAAHVDVWERIKQQRPSFYGLGYEYFPRGRVWIKNGAAVIFLNPVLQNPKVIKKIKEFFELPEKTDASVTVPYKIKNYNRRN